MIGSNFLHFLKVRVNAEKPVTQTSANERALIRNYAKNALVSVEIGVFEAVNTVEIAKVISEKGVLYGIDPFFPGKLGINCQKQISLYHIRRNKVVDKVKLVEKLSFDAASDVPDNIDFIFIDGDHSWEGIEKDWNLWTPKVKSGGIVALHDTNYPAYDATYSAMDSIKFFNEVILRQNGFELVEKVDSLSVMRKK